jgi:serine/threonine protein kinase
MDPIREEGAEEEERDVVHPVEAKKKDLVTPEKKKEVKSGVKTLKTVPLDRKVLEYRPRRIYRPKYKTFILSNGVMEVEQRYEIKTSIGHGAYGTVCSATDLKTGKPCAIKKIENIFEHRSLAKRTLRELILLRQFRHENVLHIDRVMRPRKNFNNVYFVSELLETDLASVIRSPQDLTDEHCQFFIYQTLRGLKYIHSAGVIHRDMKPRNLLVNSNCDLKICDFGLARLHEPENNDRCVMSNYIATRWYRAPEVILSRKKYTKAVDIWAVGCILAELIGRKPIFPGIDAFHQIKLIIGVIGTPTEIKDEESRDFIAKLPKKKKVPFSELYPTASKNACDLLERLLTFDPDERITVEEALRHPYLEELHCEEDEPICETFKPFEFYWEYLRLTKEDLRVLIEQEIVGHYELDLYEAKAAPKQSVAQMVSSVPSRKSKKPLKRRNSWPPRK